MAAELDRAHVELVKRFYRAFDDGAISDALGLFADDLETVDPGMGTVHGIPPFREYLETLKRAVPDARAEISHLYDAGEAVVVEGRFVGTFTGPLATPEGDVDPTGASVDLRFADVATVVNERIVSYHTYYDQLGLLTQLGLMSDS